MIDTGTGPPVIRFGVFEIHLTAGELRKNGLKVKLQEQPFQVLALLIERRGEVVTQEELRQKLWPADTFVDFEHSLGTAIKKIRQALGDSATNPRFVETLPKRGYRFITPVHEGPCPRITRSPWPHRLPWGIAVASSLLALAVSLLHFSETPSEIPFRKLVVTLPVAYEAAADAGLAISPNGRYIAIAGGERMWLQDLEQQNPRPIAGTEGAYAPFWSPGSDFVGFQARGQLKKVSIHSGPPIQLCRTNGSEDLFRATWSPDGNSIVFPAGNPLILYEVPSSGGMPKPLITPEQTGFPPSETGLFFPHFLPAEAGGRVLVFTAMHGDETTMVVQDLDTGRQEILGPGNLPFYSPSGHLIHQPAYLSSEIWALPFSLDRLKATAKPFPIVQDGRRPTISTNQTLVYVQQESPQRQLTCLDRAGRKTCEIGRSQTDICDLRLSPDGRRLLYRIRDNSNLDLWICDLVLGSRTLLAGGPKIDATPAWSPDGRQVAFASDFDIFVQSADGSGPASPLGSSSQSRWVEDWSRDGRYILYGDNGGETGDDLWYLERDGEESEWEPHPFVQDRFDQWGAQFSPDTRYVAYVSSHSGQNEICVRRFPEGHPRVTVSINGGRKPRWRQDGKELYYLQGTTLMAVPVSTEPSFSASMPTPLFEHPALIDRWGYEYDVSADGHRFIVAETAGEEPKAWIQVVQNWFQEFRDREQD